MSVKLAVVYYSSTGNTYRLAEEVKKGAEAKGAEVRLRKVAELAPPAAIESSPAWKQHAAQTASVPEVTHEDLMWADGFAFGAPVRFGGVASQLKQFIDTTGGLWAQGKLANKVAAGFTSAQKPHGGQEVAILSLYTTFYHWGCLIVPPGFTDEVIARAGGNPYGVSATAGEQDDQVQGATLESARYLGRRLATVAQWLKVGQRESVTV